MKILHEEPRKKISKKKRVYLWAFVFFLVLLLAITFPLLSDISPTGFNIFSGEKTSDSNSPNISNSNEDVYFYAKLNSLPEIETKESLEEITIKGESGGSLNIGSQEIFLNANQDYEIVLENFDGKINFKEKEIISLRGKSEKVLINGVPIEPKSERKSRININQHLPYSSLEISGIHIQRIRHITSGSINFNDGKTVLNIENEKIEIKEFIGNLRIENNENTLSGILSYFKTDGKQNIVIE